MFYRPENFAPSILSSISFCIVSRPSPVYFFGSFIFPLLPIISPAPQNKCTRQQNIGESDGLDRNKRIKNRRKMRGESTHQRRPTRRRGCWADGSTVGIRTIPSRAPGRSGSAGPNLESVGQDGDAAQDHQQSAVNEDVNKRENKRKKQKFHHGIKKRISTVVARPIKVPGRNIARGRRGFIHKVTQVSIQRTARFSPYANITSVGA